jgi:hypothetical protein
MATPSQVKAGLDDIAQAIRAQREALDRVLGGAGSVVASLDQLPGQFADVVSTVNGYGNSDAFEVVSKAELTALTNEFVDLRARAATAAGA